MGAGAGAGAGVAGAGGGSTLAATAYAGAACPDVRSMPTLEDNSNLKSGPWTILFLALLPNNSSQMVMENASTVNILSKFALRHKFACTE